MKQEASSIPQFAARYGISRWMVYEEVKRGRLKMSKIGARSLILAGDEAEWVRNMRTLPAHPSIHTRTKVKREQMRTPANSDKQ